MTDLFQSVLSAWHWISAALIVGAALGLVSTVAIIVGLEFRKGKVIRL